MTLTLLVALAVAATPSAEPVKLAAPGLNAVGLPQDLGTFYSDHFAQRMALQPGFRVVTASQIGALIGLERQKQLIGCTDDGCVTELAGALGVDAIITGSIAKFGSSIQINLSILDARDATSLAVMSQRVSGEEAALDELNRAAERMAKEVFRAVRGPDAIPPPAIGAPAAALSPPPASKREQGAIGRFWWAPVAAGAAVAAGGGGYWFFRANDRYRELEQLTHSQTAALSTAIDLRNRGNNCLLYGGLFVAGGVLGGLALGGAAYLLDTPPSQPAVVVAPVEGGAMLVFGGAL